MSRKAEVTAGRSTGLLVVAQRDPTHDYQERCAAVSRRLATEDGVANATRVLEDAGPTRTLAP